MATRSDLRSLARIRADQDSSTFPTDAQYNTLLDFAGKAVWFDLIRAGWPANFTTVTKTATGSNPITLGVSGTIAFIRGVFRVDGGGVYTELRRLNEGDRASLMSTTGTDASHYDVRHDPTNGPVLELLPLPTSGSYVVQYVLEFAGFANDSATWPGPARSDEMVALKAAAMGCRKEGNDQGAAQLDQEYQYLLECVQGMASWFDMRNPPVIRDVNPLQPLRDKFDYEV